MRLHCKVTHSDHLRLVQSTAFVGETSAPLRHYVRNPRKDPTATPGQTVKPVWQFMGLLSHFGFEFVKVSANEGGNKCQLRDILPDWEAHSPITHNGYKKTNGQMKNKPKIDWYFLKKGSNKIFERQGGTSSLTQKAKVPQK